MERDHMEDFSRSSSPCMIPRRHHRERKPFKSTWSGRRRVKEEVEMGSYSFESEISIPSSEERRKGLSQEEPWRRKTGCGVTLEVFADAWEGNEERADGIARSKSLRGEDLEELKGCLDLGFGFNYEEIPELRNTLPALELCYSMSQRFLDEQQQNRSLDRSSSGDSFDQCESPSSPLIANWKIASPGDDPDEVKARLKYWAQAVACTIRLCN